MPVGSLNPKDNAHATGTRPTFVPSAAGARRWFSTASSTRVADQDLNGILAQIRTACDFYSIPDVEGDDNMLQKALAAATSSLTKNLAVFQALTGAADSVPYFTSASAMSMFVATSFSRSLLAKTSAVQWRDSLGISSITSDNVIALSSLSSGVDQLPYFNGVGTMAQTPFNALGRSLVGAATQSDARLALGLGDMAVQATANYVPKAGGAFTGLVSLSATAISLDLHAASKGYVDAGDNARVAKAGGAGAIMTGLLTLSGGPSSDLHAATKLYVDTRVFRGGDAMTGFLFLHADPTSSSHAANKNYVDARDALAMPKLGGTFTGLVTMPATPITANLHVATKVYVDAFMPKAGGTFSGLVTLSGPPTVDLHAATKRYVDDTATGSSTLYMPKTGGRFTGLVEFGAANYGASYDSGTSIAYLTFALDDHLLYDRADNQWTFQAGGVNIMSVTPDGISSSQKWVGHLRIGDPDMNLILSGAGPTFQFDANDFMRFDRPSDKLSFFIANVTKLSLDVDNITAQVPLWLAGTAFPTLTNHATHKGYVDAADATLDAKINTLAGTYEAQTNYTASAFPPVSDVGNVLACNSATDMTLTIRDQTLRDWPANAWFDVLQLGVGGVIIAGAAPATVSSLNNKFKTSGRYAVARVFRRSLDNWIVSGDLV